MSKQRAQERRRGGNTELARQPVQEVCLYTFITTCNHIKLTFLSTENRKVSEWVAIERRAASSVVALCNFTNTQAQDDGAAAAGRRATSRIRSENTRNRERADGRRRSSINSAGRAPPSVSTTLRTNKRLRIFK